MDVLNFTLKNGETVEAIPVKETPDGTLYCFRDCVRLQFPMVMTGKCVLPAEGSADARMIREKYAFTDLNKFLNTYILDLFPDNVRKNMIPAFNKVSDSVGEYLRIPYEKEIFGTNVCGIDDGDDVEQWECMKDNRTLRSAKVEGKIDLYWLRTPYNTDADPNYRDGKLTLDVFTIGANGIPVYEVSCRAHGIRPVFMMRKETQTPRMEINPNWMKKCLCLPAKNFETACKTATGRDDLGFHYDLDGLWIEGDDDKEEITDETLNKIFSDLFGINVTSIHIDDCDLTGVWIVYA